MSQDASKIVLGATAGSFKVVQSYKGSIEAALGCVQKSDGTITKTLSDGALLGISVGGDLSGDSSHMSICRAGSQVPIQLGSAFTPTIGAQVQLHATSGQAVASGTAVNATFSSGVLTGIKEDGTTCNVALIEMAGGL